MKRVIVLAVISAGALSVLSLLPLQEERSFGGEIKAGPPAIPWSRLPPAGLAPAEVPQFIAVTFDDNFGLAAQSATSGASPIVEFFSNERNPASERESDFGGAPICVRYSRS